MALLTEAEIELTDADFSRVRDVIYRHCGINLHEGKRALVRARLAKRVRAYRMASFGDYLDYALSEGGHEEFVTLVDSISTNLTSFFRERSHFDYLAEHFIPAALNDRRREGGARFRVWSAGCSSGEEPYSLAITLQECFQGQGRWDIKILASDVSTRILKRAQEGVYDPERVAPLSPQQKQKYLELRPREGRKAYAVRPILKDMIRFRYLNLMERWPFRGQFDVIFCRNVMIYFDKPTQERLVARYHEHLRPGGLLCIGHSESLTGIEHRYRYVQPATYVKV